MADRGFTALKFDLDLPLLPGEDLYARTISPAQLDRQVALAEATVAAVARQSGRRLRPPLALRAGRRAAARSRARAPAPALARGSDAASGPRVRRAHRRANDDADLHGREPLSPRRVRRARWSTAGSTSSRRTSRRSAGSRTRRRIAALGDVHSRPLAPHNIAGPIGTLASAHVCASIPNFLALEWHAASVPFFDELVTLGRPVIEDGYVALPDAPGNRRRARPRGGSTLRASRCSRSSHEPSA